MKFTDVLCALPTLPYFRYYSEVRCVWCNNNHRNLFTFRREVGQDNKLYRA